MRIHHAGASALALSIMALSATCATADSRLKLVVAGEAYAGPPEYELRAGDHVLARGAIAGARDTESAGFLDEKSLRELGQTLEFDIPDGIESVTLAFTNDAWSGPETGFDRNLYVVSATLNGVELPLTTMKWVQGTEVHSEVPIVHGALALRYFGDSAIIPLVPLAKATEAAGPEPVGEAAPIPTDRPRVTVAAPLATQVPCVEPLNFVIEGFANNSAEIPENSLPKLQDAIEKAKTGCSLRVTGYASRSGPPEWNRTVAARRAEAVRAYLSGRAEYTATEVVVGGETLDFGSATANRAVRVEIIAP